MGVWRLRTTGPLTVIAVGSGRRKRLSVATVDYANASKPPIAAIAPTTSGTAVTAGAAFPVASPAAELVTEPAPPVALLTMPPAPPVALPTALPPPAVALLIRLPASAVSDDTAEPGRW